MSTLDRLSVRTEITPGHNTTTLPSTANLRKAITLPTDDTLNSNERLLYFSPNEKENIDCLPKTLKIEISESLGQDLTSSLDVKSGPTSASSIHDTILATQLRHINREMTPTISEVYHERNIGLGLAPPLSKLLLSQNTSSQPTPDNSVLDKIKLGILEDSEAEKDTNCARCKTDSCTCRSKTTKPWLSESVVPLQQIQSSDLTTADILERETKNKKWQTDSRNKETDCEPKRLSPFSEMSRRDEGDGRSIADSQCSSSYNKRTAGYRMSTQSNFSLTSDKTNPRMKLPQMSTQRNRNNQL